MSRTPTYAADGKTVIGYTESTPPVPESANADTIQSAALQALANNRAFIASTPTAAQLTAQVKALSRQNNGIIRLLLNQLDGTD